MTSIEHGPDAQPVKPRGDAPVVQTPSGAVRGVMLGDSQAAYLGIPYAEPPVGPLRYAAPVKRAPWDGVRDASRYGATPLRASMTSLTLIPEPAFPGDDTLLVNVFTPKPGDSAAALPVFVWIHGGGFVTGSPSSSWYDGGAFPRDGVVVVSVSYRLGFDGFGRIAGAPDNRAVRDWILALEWVRDSIAQFGGDPSRVTIGGQSAGGSAVLTLLAMPAAQDLFHGVIAESPGVLAGDPDASVERVANLAERLGIAPTREAFASLDEEAVFQAQLKMGEEEMGPQMIRGLTRGTSAAMGWAPVVDGDLVPSSIEDAIALGVGADKRLLIGATANEFDMVSAMLPAKLEWLPRGLVLRIAGFDARAARSYGTATSGKPRVLFGRVMTDFVFRFNVARTLAGRTTQSAEALAQTETRAPAQGTFAYDFRFANPENGLTGHCIELPFAWDVLDGDNIEANTGPNPPQQLADTVHGAWVAFIRDGDPGWPAYDPAQRQGMVFERESRVAEVYRREADLVDSPAVRRVRP